MYQYSKVSHFGSTSVAYRSDERDLNFYCVFVALDGEEYTGFYKNLVEYSKHLKVAYGLGHHLIDCGTLERPMKIG